MTQKKKPPAKVGKKEEKKEKDFSNIHKNLVSKYPPGNVLTFVSSGSLMLDKILGGGVPLGRWVEIASEAGLGKSTVALHVCLSFIEQGYFCAYFDFEKAINQSLMDGVGVSPYLGTKFAMHKGDTWTDLEELINSYLKIPKLGLIVIDSINHVLPEKLMEEPVEKIFPGIQAQLQGKFLFKYKAAIVRNDVAVILINQVRTKIGMTKFEPTKKEAAGGMALSHSSDIRILMRASQRIKRGSGENTKIIGVDVGMETTKNKVIRPYVRGVLSVLFGKGVSNVRTIALYLIKEKVAVRSADKSPYFAVSLDSSVDPKEKGEKVQGEAGLEEWVRSHYSECIEFLRTHGYLEVEE